MYRNDKKHAEKKEKNLENACIKRNYTVGTFKLTRKWTGNTIVFKGSLISFCRPNNTAVSTEDPLPAVQESSPQVVAAVQEVKVDDGRTAEMTASLQAVQAHRDKLLKVRIVNRFLFKIK